MDANQQVFLPWSCFELACRVGAHARRIVPGTLFHGIWPQIVQYVLLQKALDYISINREAWFHIKKSRYELKSRYSPTENSVYEPVIQCNNQP